MGTPPKSGRELLAEHVAAQRVAFRSAGDLPVSDGELAAIAAEASARAAAADPTSGLASIAGLLPAAASILTQAFRRVRPKLWAIESERYVPRPSFDVAHWERVAEAKALDRERGDVGYGTLCGIVRAFGKLFRQGKGAATKAYEYLAPEAGCSRETLRRGVQYFEDAGLLHVWNRTDRPTDGPLKNQVIRVANMYLAVMPGEVDPRLASAAETASETEKPTRAQLWLARVARQIERGETWFRLAGRRLGLNLTPMRPRAAPA